MDCIRWLTRAQQTTSSPRQAIATTPRERHAGDGLFYTAGLRHFSATDGKKRAAAVSFKFSLVF